MFKHRPGEGVYARGVAFWAFAGFAFLYARRLVLWLERYDSMRKVLVEEVPLVGVALTPGLLIGLGVFAGIVLLVWRLLNVPRIGDLLIDTELEMKKVTWPSGEETRKSAMVVILCVIVMVAFLSASDMSLEWLFYTVIYGGTPDGR